MGLTSGFGGPFKRLHFWAFKPTFPTFLLGFLFSGLYRLALPGGHFFPFGVSPGKYFFGAPLCGRFSLGPILGLTGLFFSSGDRINFLGLTIVFPIGGKRAGVSPLWNLLSPLWVPIFPIFLLGRLPSLLQKFSRRFVLRNTFFSFSGQFYSRVWRFPPFCGEHNTQTRFFFLHCGGNQFSPKRVVVLRTTFFFSATSLLPLTPFGGHPLCSATTFFSPPQFFVFPGFPGASIYFLCAAFISLSGDRPQPQNGFSFLPLSFERQTFFFFRGLTSPTQWGVFPPSTFHGALFHSGFFFGSAVF